jgi:hypothetical protein
MEDNLLPAADTDADPQDITGTSTVSQKAATITGSVEFGSDTSWFSASSTAKFNTGSMAKFPVQGAVAGSFEVEFVLYAPDGITNGTRLCEVRQTGVDRIIRLTYSATDTVVLSVHQADGTQVGTSGSLSIPINRNHKQFAIFGWLGQYQLFYKAMSGRQWIDSGAAVSGASVTSDQVYEVRLNANQLMNGAYLGHVAVFDGTYSATYPYGSYLTWGNPQADPLDAWRREPAARRAERLTWEEQLINYNIGSGGPQMGIQSPKSYVELMQEVQATDMGYVYEPRNVLGLGYRTRTSMYNPPAILTLSYSGDNLSGEFNPIKDNRVTANDVTVIKDFGSSGRYTLTSGAMSINNPPNGIGRYSDEETISLYRDRDLVGQAQWRVYVGTNQDLRVDTITIALENPRIGGVADNIYRFLTADIGDRIVLSGLSPMQYDNMELTIVGYSETFDQFQHMITFNCVPGSVFATAQTVTTDTTTSSKTDSTTTTLAGTMTTTSTSRTVNVASGALWTTSGVDFDIMVNGERMTVSSVSGSSSPQTFTVVRSVNGVVKTHASGETVTLFKKAYTAL